MKTYKIFYVLWACWVVVGCSKSEDGGTLNGESPPDSPGTKADYTLLLQKEGILTSILLNAETEAITVNPTESPFPNITFPELTYTDGHLLGLYQKKTLCEGRIMTYDFKEDQSQEMEIFMDLEDCNLTANAIARSEDTFYVAYQLEITSKETAYFVRILDLNSDESEFTDIELDKKPVQMVMASNRLFILTLDEEITDEYALSVMDTNTKLLIHEMDLGFDVRRIFKTPEKDIIISYDELHTTLDSATMSFKYTQYDEGTEPNFMESDFEYFDDSGKMYYEMLSGSNSMYPFIPAVYDFKASLGVLYAFENFLTETQRDFEFEIESTSLVSYDEKNGLILVGYKKNSGDDKGGLLRIKPIPNPEFIDNLDLEGVPFQIFVE
ncbi:hypothetical protein [Ulvibacterium sp.]|uniref:hypothetical protein n=1 Tax=Ulvibacterium sp. TaxID=2665914 RepID=UPI003BA9073E